MTRGGGIAGPATPHAPRRWDAWRRATTPLLISVGLISIGLISASLVVLLPTAAAAVEQTQTAASDAAPESPDVVVILGTAGLTWSDITPERAPTLSGWNGQLGQLVVRSARAVGCPVDGWLTLSAGNRSADNKPCGSIAPTSGHGPVPRWNTWQTLAEEGEYGSAPGAWGDSHCRDGLCHERASPHRC